MISDVEGLPGQLDSVPPPRLLLISFTTNYGDDNLFQPGTLPAYVQVGVGFHLAALAELAGDVQLATCLRHRDAWTREREALESRMDALLLSADSSSQTPPAIGSN